MLFISRIIDGLSGGNIAIARAYIADITTEENRARGFGLIGAAFGLGYIFGPAIGGAFSHISYSAPAWIAAGLAFIATILTWFLLPETNHQASAGRKIQWSSVKNLLSRPIISNLLGIDFLYWATFAVYQTTFALFVAHRFNFNASETGYLLAFLSIIGVIMQLAIVGIVVKKFGERKVLASGLALVSLGLAGASLTTNLILLMITLIPASTGYALAAPTLISLISQTVTQEEQGSLQGLSGSLESFGRVVGPIWGNGFLEKFGESSPYFSASFAMIVLSFWIIFLKQKK
jgi:DHA1 family tetracycline resistance protein-like MFS transporter